MKPASLSTIFFAILTMTFVAQNAMGETTFDGNWWVTAITTSTKTQMAARLLRRS
jgi:hypothetical protein